MNLTKETFDRVNEMYMTLNSDSPNYEAEFDALSNALEEHDFSLMAFRSADGTKIGLKWPYGKILVPAIYDSIERYVTCAIPVYAVNSIACRDGRYFLINPEGKEIFEADHISALDLGLITPYIFQHGGKEGVISCHGHVILPAAYDNISTLGNGFILLMRHGKYGLVCPYVDIIEPQFDEIKIDSEERITVSLNGQWGYIDEDGHFTESPNEAYLSMEMGL